MASTKRTFLRKRIAQAHNNLNRAAEDLIYLQDVFKDAHGDLADALSAMIYGISMLCDSIDAFCDRAWGYHPEHYDKWRNLPPPKTKANKEG